MSTGAAVNIESARPSGERAFIDLHCHTSASFDCLSDPTKVVRAAAARGLTHLVVTDHDGIDGALRARDAAPDGLTVIIGEEVRTADGDLIAAFLESPVAPGVHAADTIAAVRAQGGLVGIPHPFDRFRGSLLRDARMASLAPMVDWVETHNARIVGGGNERAAAFAAEHDLPGVAVSDAHTIVEIGVAYTALTGDPSTPSGLLAAFLEVELVPGRASYAVRLWTPVAKGIQRVCGRGRGHTAVGA
ncbi:MAG TPA: PHP domain-containing protein [Candidatus Limnocylindrales bacterium]|nr:PHP domain-containing protein [Candidatus Limnocylindrales bacterium]